MKKIFLRPLVLLGFSFFFYVTTVHFAQANLEENFIQALQEQWEQTQESTVFLELFKAKKFKEAFYHWDVSFEQSAFNRSATGKALYAYLLFKNKIRIMGLQTLFEINNSEDILEELRDLWRVAAPYYYRTWNFVDVKWSPEWTNVFDLKTELVVLLSKTFSIKDLEALDMQFKDIASQMPNWLWWRVIVALAIRDRSNGAIMRLNALLKSKTSPISSDLIHVTMGRILFQEKAYGRALQAYRKISRASDYWLIAQEEIAWLYLLNNRPERTLGYTQTLMHPVLTNQVGPEASYLHALASLQVCDYKESLETLRAFHDRFATRIKDLRRLTQTGRTPAGIHLRKTILRLKNSPLNVLNVGWQARQLPSLAHRDRSLSDFVRAERRLLLERRRVRALRAGINKSIAERFKDLPEEDRKPAEMAANSYSKAFLTALEQKIKEKKSYYNRRFYKRLRLLARRDLKEFEQVVQKLQIVDAEVLQFVALKLPSLEAQEAYLKRKEKQKPLVVDHLNDMKAYRRVFLNTAPELWFDELGFYRVHVNACLE